MRLALIEEAMPKALSAERREQDGFTAVEHLLHRDASVEERRLEGRFGFA